MYTVITFFAIPLQPVVFFLGIALGIVGIVLMILRIPRMGHVGKRVFYGALVLPTSLLLAYMGFGLIGLFRAVPQLDPFDVFLYGQSHWSGYLFVLAGGVLAYNASRIIRAPREDFEPVR